MRTFHNNPEITPMQTKNIKVTLLTHNIKDLRFAIDSPKQEKICLSNSLLIKLSGWVLYNGKAADIIIKNSGGNSHYVCDRSREDVIKKLKYDVTTTDEKCGYFIPIFGFADFEMGFIIDGVVVWVAKIQLTEPHEIITGKNGYLYLDNDSNNSVAQFTGEKLISNTCMSAWSGYFSKLDSYSKQEGIGYVFILAPAKEIVLPMHYPHTKGKITPAEQFFDEFKSYNILYPLEELCSTDNATYSRLDTHWTDYGAGVVVNAALEKLGISNHNSFPFSFNMECKTGDLSYRLPTLPRENRLIADFSSVKLLQVFNNNINNTGKLIVFENPAATTNKKIIVFGDSFSANMIPYFVKEFTRVVFVHSCSNVDYDILDHESPDFIFCEITTRFIVQPPSKTYDVSDVCKIKIDDMSLKDKNFYIDDLMTSNDLKHNFYTKKTLCKL